MAELTVHELHRQAEAMLQDTAPGDPLTALEKALISLGLAASVTALCRKPFKDALEAARLAGATAVQIQEIVSLISGLGVHSLMASAVEIADACALNAAALTPEQQALWNRYVGDDPFWTAFEAELPGFLGAMLRLSADQFAAFFDYCAVPWKTRQVSAKLKELAAMASDATPAHRFGPGFRLHLRNAIKLGAGRRAVMETLALAAAAPAHEGFA
jgi:alkylhydroperoxidase/carboxymuconolactone decarboxylase family protein YurZ